MNSSKESLRRDADARPIDLRSDTVTRPTAAMYDAMINAELGDDGLDGDPTARELEQTTATMLGKEAGVYFPSATMANLASLREAGILVRPWGTYLLRCVTHRHIGPDDVDQAAAAFASLAGG